MLHCFRWHEPLCLWRTWALLVASAACDSASAESVALCPCGPETGTVAGSEQRSNVEMTKGKG